MYYGFSGIGVKALVAIPLLFFSATVGAHALARGSYLFGIRPGDETVLDEYKNVNEKKKGGTDDTDA